MSLQLPRERVQWETAVAQSRRQTIPHCETVEAEAPLMGDAFKVSYRFLFSVNNQ